MRTDIEPQQVPTEAYAWARLHSTLADDVDGLGSTKIAPDRASGTPPPPTPAATSRMMAPRYSPFWADFADAMQARVDRIEVACLIVGILMFLMIAGRVAFALVMR